LGNLASFGKYSKKLDLLGKYDIVRESLERLI
jgi:hypothetical protein